MRLTSSSSVKYWRIFSGAIGIVAALVLVFANANQAPSEEWLYTTEILNRVLPFLIILALIFAIANPCKFKPTPKTITGLLFLLASCLCLAVPIFSAEAQYLPWKDQLLLSSCWSGAFICFGIFLFIAASSYGAILTWLGCIFGSLSLGLGCLELALLLTEQPADGFYDASAASQFALNGEAMHEGDNWISGVCGHSPVARDKPYAIAHKLQRYDKAFFDVKYSFNELGHRQLPRHVDAPNALALFGGSFTFGHGLMDEATWAWRLAKILGPQWNLENYAANGFGAHQMLCQCENDLIDFGNARHRYALFLALNHHIRRNEFFPNQPHYTVDAVGDVKREGKAQYSWLASLAWQLNGSQLAREAQNLATALLLKQKQPDLVNAYLALLKKGAAILANKYNARLTVLLWPDTEYLAPELKKANIPVLFARDFLFAWETDEGARWRIDPRYEAHPNEAASMEIAKGLAAYFESMAKK